MIYDVMKGKIEEKVIEKVATTKRGWVPSEISGLGLSPDLAFEEGEALIFVETASRGDPQALARLALYDRLVKKQGREVVLVLAAKSFSDQVLALADRLGIRTVVLPRGSPAPRIAVNQGRVGIKLTSEKAWRVVTRLLKDQPMSIRSVSLREKVSYGWAHAVCEHLLAQGMARRKGNMVELTDVERLINGVAWERPLQNLRSVDIHTDIEDGHSCAREVDRTLKEAGVDHSFTGFLAGSLYTGTAVRYDLVQMYVDEDEFDVLREIYSRPEGKGATLQLISPDRDAFTGANIVDGLRLASPGLTLLDLAGSGPGAIELRRAMVRDYARL